MANFEKLRRERAAADEVIRLELAPHLVGMLDQLTAFEAVARELPNGSLKSNAYELISLTKRYVTLLGTPE